MVFCFCSSNNCYPYSYKPLFHLIYCLREEKPIYNKQLKNFDIWFAGIIYFVIIPLILTIVFLLSDSLKDLLSLYPSNPTFLSILGSNYLHTTFPHFISNLIFYLVAMTFIFVFDKLTNRKMLFVNLLLLFIILPIVSSLLNIVILSDFATNMSHKGFSAIVAGVFGYLTYSTLHFITNYYEVKFEKGILQLMWLILYVNLAIISLVYGYYLIILLVSVLILLSIFNTKKDIKKIITLLRKLKRPARVAVFTSLYLCLCVGMVGLFPGSLQNSGNLVNILAHYVGYIFGFMVPALISIYIFDKRKLVF
ncbi:hypothetical protein MBGDF03_01005 [Thermoplasmatales archaeon SCGC AB-540-F20]|nr:hypothetical protein MBGDF03_01005 [Thermoplasmatales archaeon SCGC AB-540-F20]